MNNYGVIIGACIAGLITISGWNFSKKSKLSEFRQEWINALREDVAKFISSYMMYMRMDALATSKGKQKTDENYSLENKLKRVAELEDAANDNLAEALRLRNTILLRLNPIKRKRKGGERTLYDTLKSIEAGKIENKVIVSIEENTGLVLKKEWNRVKRGDISRMSSFITKFVLCAFIVYVFFELK